MVMTSVTVVLLFLPVTVVLVVKTDEVISVIGHVRVFEVAGVFVLVVTGLVLVGIGVVDVLVLQ